jgi:NADP-dependent 3-hydroxy acid dehydrogenase YdfG
LATARLFIAEGAQVVITGRDKATLDAASKELGKNTGRLLLKRRTLFNLPIRN